MLLTFAGIEQLLSPLDCFCILVAAVGHDLGHNGWTNEIENELHDGKEIEEIRRTRSQTLGIPQVADRKLFPFLESFHATLLCDIMNEPDSRLFTDRCPEHIHSDARHTIVSAVMATDMQCHRDLISAADDRAKTLHHDGLPFATPATGDDRELIICNVLHAADISNPCMAFDVSAKWARLVDLEMCAQKSKLAELQRCEGGCCNCCFQSDTLTLAKGQVFFLGTICLPYMESLRALFPAMNHLTDRGRANLSTWFKKLIIIVN